MSSPAITCTPASPTAAADFCRVEVSHTPNNDVASFNSAVYPTAPEVRYYLAFTESGTEYGRSPEFSTSPDEAWVFNNYTFPHAGTWTLTLADASNDSTVATLSVTVA